VDAPVTTNSQRLDGLVHNGKIYLSLADAIVLGLENNYDIAIQRYNLDIADTDLLRARPARAFSVSAAAWCRARWVARGPVRPRSASGGGPGGTSTAVRRRRCRFRRPRATTNGSGPTPEVLDPVLTGTIQLERTTTPEPTPFASGSPP
jgi:outer membrane protein